MGEKLRMKGRKAIIPTPAIDEVFTAEEINAESNVFFFFAGAVKKNTLLSAFISSAVKTSSMAGVGIIAFLPFILNFSPIAQGILPVHSRTPLWQLGVLWGFPAVMTGLFLFFIFKFLKGKLKPPDGFVLAILAASWILVFIPEMVFVKDIYIASHYRANTMFKLTYQAYIMFYLAAGYIAIRLLGKLKKIWRFVGIGFFSLLLDRKS